MRSVLEHSAFLVQSSCRSIPTRTTILPVLGSQYQLQRVEVLPFTLFYAFLNRDCTDLPLSAVAIRGYYGAPSVLKQHYSPRRWLEQPTNKYTCWDTFFSPSLIESGLRRH